MPGQLDDLKYLHQIDSSDALGLVSKQWQQLEHEFQLDITGINSGVIENIVYSGMGNSALSAQLSTSWPGYLKPFEIIRGYDLPLYTNEKTLFIASSYSGNTEETLASLVAAEAAKAQIIIITSGGLLLDIAKQKQYTLVALPKIDRPRFGVLYCFKGLVLLAEKLGLMHKGMSAELSSAALFLGRSIAEWLPDVPVSQNAAKQLALDLTGTSPVIYGGPLLASAAHKWKISYNLNAKNVAWANSLPEFCHYELSGWTSHPVEKPYGIVYLQSSFDDDRIKRRFELSDKLLSGRWPSPHPVQAKGETKVQQLLWAVALGDFVSLYGAFLNGTNPIESGDADIIEKFKLELGVIT